MVSSHLMQNESERCSAAVVPSMEHGIQALKARTVLALLVDRIVGPEGHEGRTQLAQESGLCTQRNNA
jgi:hypothetical protein